MENFTRGGSVCVCVYTHIYMEEIILDFSTMFIIDSRMIFVF